MNLHDAYGAFLDKIALPVEFKPGRAYKLVHSGEIRMAKCTRVLPDGWIEMQIYGQGTQLVGKQDLVYGLSDHIRPPTKLLK